MKTASYKKQLKYILLLVAGAFYLNAYAQQQQPYSQRAASTAMTLWRDSLPTGNRWTYDQGVILKGIEGVWQQTANNTYFKFIQDGMDKFVSADGIIKTYSSDGYNLDFVLCGRNLLTLYRVTGDEKYLKAARILRDQLKNQPRTPEGGFWHKKVYPNQMWLDGLYMAEPFYAEYATTMHEDTAFNDIARQFILIEKHTRDSKTGLLYHGWDSSRQERWADPVTGHSPNFWGRAMGWYGMALVDVLDYFPANHPERPILIAILKRYAAAIAKYQDNSSGLWYQVLDKGNEKGNYPEASASCMFVYTIAKAVREHYLPESYLRVAQKGYKGIISQFVTNSPDGQLALNGTVSVSGLGGKPHYRDGSYAYYLSEKVVTNDPKGVGAFILASVEMERLTHLNEGKGKTVLLDSYFNDEHKKDATGTVISYHYKWNERDNGGYSFFGWAFNNYGLQTNTLYDAPNSNNLKQASIYIITDPDIPKENPDAKYILPTHIKAITDWVRKGGVLVIMNNDTGNAEFVHLNHLMAKFGMKFNLNSINHVQGAHFEQGAISIDDKNRIFKNEQSVYIKELSSLSLTPPAIPYLKKDTDIIIAVSKYGRGTVFAVGDPWFYNEYTDGRKLPPQYENYKAAQDLVAWLVKRIPTPALSTKK